MPKDVTKILNFNVDKIEIGTSAAGTEPAVYTDIGLVDDEKLTVKLTPEKRGEIGGGNIQMTNVVEFGTSMMQVKDYAVAEGFKNANCWIKATDKGGAIVKIKNVYINVELDLQLFAKGKSAIMLTGATYAGAISDVIVFPA